MKVDNPKFNVAGFVECTDCPFQAESGFCDARGARCPIKETYAEDCRTAERRAAREKSEAAAPLAAEMTIRDHFAATALNALLTWSNACDISPESHAVTAYGLADAMMKERAK